ncbi:MAG: YihY/virulence factor BrkB family protein [bacterium]
MINYVKKIYENFDRIIRRPEMAILPGQLAYFLVVAIIPTVTLLSLGATFLNLSTEAIFTFFSNSFSPDVANLILSAEVGLVEDSYFAGFIILAGYYVSSNGACSIIVTSNTIYGIKNKGYIKRHLKAFLMILILLFLLILMLFVPMFGDKIILFLQETSNSVAFTNNVILLFAILKGPLFWFILFCFIKLIYVMAPDKKIEYRNTNVGALFTTVSWIIVSYVYSIYINNFANYSELYGNLANLIVIMLWFYFLAYCFTIGLALNYNIEEDKNLKKE